MKMFKSFVAMLLVIALFTAIGANEASDENGESTPVPQLQTTSAPTETRSAINASTSTPSATLAPNSEQKTSPGNSHTVPSNETAPSTTKESDSISGESVDCARVLTMTAYTIVVSWILKTKSAENIEVHSMESISRENKRLATQVK